MTYYRGRRDCLNLLLQLDDRNQEFSLEWKVHREVRQ